MLKKLNLTYTQIIALGFLLLIIAGATLLCLPAASRAGQATPFIDSILTSASATCVTGLSVYNTWEHWSLFGQIVIIVLIQAGGLGFMTVITLFSYFMRRNIGIRERRILMQSAGNIRLSGTVRLLRKIFFGTLIFEGAGAALLAFVFCPTMGAKGIYYAVFHSISAFCNAGFDLMGKFGEVSFTAHSGNVLVNITLMALIIIGGIGFLVWEDILKHGIHFRRYELHSKIVISATISLILIGAAALYITEYSSAFAGMSTQSKWLAAFFQSVTTRTAGFNTVDQGSLSDAGSLISMVLMLIGGSPGSTAGGIKTSTFIVLLFSTVACARNNGSVIIFKRRIDDNTVRQSVAIVTIYMAAVVIFSTVMCVIEDLPLKNSIYEVVSAIATVGLSMSVTPTLGVASKIILTFLMYAGRIGGLSIVIALAEKRVKVPLDRPVEKILIG